MQIRVEALPASGRVDAFVGRSGPGGLWPTDPTGLGESELGRTRGRSDKMSDRFRLIT